MPLSLGEIRVRRFSTPTIPVKVLKEDGTARDLTGHALRYTVTQRKEGFESGLGTPPFEFELFSINPVILAGTDGDIEVVLPLPITSLPPGRYGFGELRGREDGTDPLTPDKPDYSDELPFVVVDSAEIEP